MNLWDIFLIFMGIKLSFEKFKFSIRWQRIRTKGSVIFIIWGVLYDMKIDVNL